MGYSVFTVAVRGRAAPLICADFGLLATERSEEEPESPVVGALLPGGWYLIYINDRIAPPEAVLKSVSTRAELVCCAAEEHVMYSSASGWTNGEEAWSITHDAQVAAEHLEATGTLPAEFPSIAERLRRQQRDDGGADFIFDIPVEVALALTGFRYDGSNPGGYPVERFEVLSRPVTKRWWEFWK